MPVCKHRGDAVLISTRKNALAAPPVVRCRAGRGHPPAYEYRWKFYPETTAAAGSSFDDGGSYGMPLGTAAGEPDPSSLAAGTAVAGPDVGASYTFTTSTPVLRSFVTAVKAAAAAAASSPSGAAAARPNSLLRGRLECRAVNSMGAQKTPCVYRVSGENDTTAELTWG